MAGAKDNFSEAIRNSVADGLLSSFSKKGKGKDADARTIFGVRLSPDEFDKVSKAIADAMASVGPAVAKSRDKATDAVTNAPGADKFEEQFSAAIVAIDKGQAVAREKARGGTETVKAKSSQAAEVAKEKTSQAAETAKSATSQLAETAKEKTSQAAETAKVKTVQAAETAKDKTSQTAEIAKEKTSQAAETAKEKTSQAAEAAKEKTSQAAETAKLKTSQAAETAKAATSQAAEMALVKTSQAVDTAKHTTSHMAHETADASKNLLGLAFWLAALGGIVYYIFLNDENRARVNSAAKRSADIAKGIVVEIRGENGDFQG